MEKKELILDPWQQDILDAKGHILLCTGRQVGKTMIFARKAAERMIAQPNCHIIAVSLTEDQAFLMKIMVQDYIQQNYKQYLKVKKSLKPTKNTINLNNGSTYRVRPVGNTGDAVRGFTGDILIVDEASRMPELMWMAAKPTLLTTGGDIWMCSTPHGKIGYFYECWLNRENQFFVKHISSEDVIYNRPPSKSWSGDIREKRIRFLETEKATMSELRYGQEYLGLFQDDLKRFFTDDWVDDACTEKKEARLTGRDYYLGVDIARLGGDETTFEIVRKVNSDTMLHVYNETATKQLTTWTEERIIQLDTLYDFRRIYIDAGAGSLGVGIFDHLLRDDRTKRKVEAINNRKIVMDREGKSKQRLLKEDLYDNLRSLGQKNQIHILDEDNVRLSLRSIQYEYIKKANQISQLRIFGDYAHIVEGLIRAAWCSKEKNIKVMISSFPI